MKTAAIALIALVALACVADTEGTHIAVFTAIRDRPNDTTAALCNALLDASIAVKKTLWLPHRQITSPVQLLQVCLQHFCLPDQLSTPNSTSTHCAALDQSHKEW
jgi:hypothetical protein